MKENDAKIGAMVGVLTVVITQVLLRALGVNKISTIIYITLILLIGITFAVMMIRSKNKKLGKKNCIMAGVLMLLMCISNATAMLLIRCYPEFGDEHKIIAMSIIFSAFITFIIVGVFWTVILAKLSKKSNRYITA